MQIDITIGDQRFTATLAPTPPPGTSSPSCP